MMDENRANKRRLVLEVDQSIRKFGRIGREKSLLLSSAPCQNPEGQLVGPPTNLMTGSNSIGLANVNTKSVEDFNVSQFVVKREATTTPSPDYVETFSEVNQEPHLINNQIFNCQSTQQHFYDDPCVPKMTTSSNGFILDEQQMVNITPKTASFQFFQTQDRRWGILFDNLPEYFSFQHSGKNFLSLTPIDLNDPSRGLQVNSLHEYCYLPCVKLNVTDINIAFHEPEQQQQTITLEKLWKAVSPKLLKYLTMEDLKTLRLLNSNWKSMVTKIIRSRPLRTISFTYDTTADKYISTYGHPKKTLNDLSEYLDSFDKSMDNFPEHFFSISFSNVHFGCVDLTRYFRSHGHSLQTLRFHLPTELEIWLLWKLFYITSQLSTLEIFSLLPGSTTKYEALCCSKTFKSNELTQILWDLDPKGVLNCIQKIDIDDLKQFLRQPVPQSFLENHLPCVKFQDFGDVSDFRVAYLAKSMLLTLPIKNLKILEGFALAQPKLRQLRIDLNNTIQPEVEKLDEISTRISMGISVILNSSQFTLTHLVITGEFFHNGQCLSRVTWPSLPNLKELTLRPAHVPITNLENCLCTSKDYFIVPRTLHLSFPTLRKLELTLSHHGIKNISFHSFPFSRQEVKTVETLEFSCADQDVAANWLKRFCLIFPKTRHLIVRNILVVSKVAPPIWKFSKLKSLELDVSRGGKFLREEALKLESIFTGLTPEICNNLDRVLRTNTKMIFYDLERWRINPSIVDLRGLADLKILLRNDTSDKVNIIQQYFPVSASYAFDMIPVSVFFIYDKLEKVQQYQSKILTGGQK